MTLNEWDTIVSNCGMLYFSKIVDKGLEGKFFIGDEKGNKYYLDLANVGPYLIASEEDLINYWRVKNEKGLGWTFLVADSPFKRLFGPPSAATQMTHYVLATQDTCIEILSMTEPKIHLLPKEFDD